MRKGRVAAFFLAAAAAVLLSGCSSADGSGERIKLKIATVGNESHQSTIAASVFKEKLEEIAGEITKTIYDLGLPHESSSFKRITISVGYACQRNAAAKDYIQLLECADRALYEAKNQGRNKISGYGG